MIGTTAFSALRSCQARRQGFSSQAVAPSPVDQTGTTTIRGAALLGEGDPGPRQRFAHLVRQEVDGELADVTPRAGALLLDRQARQHAADLARRQILELGVGAVFGNAVEQDAERLDLSFGNRLHLRRGGVPVGGVDLDARHPVHGIVRLGARCGNEQQEREDQCPEQRSIHPRLLAVQRRPSSEPLLFPYTHGDRQKKRF